MDQNNSKDIVDRLKAEGQLTRNTGTNSIKSINKNIDKFSSVLDTIHDAIVFQTGILQETLKLERSTILKNDREKQILKAERSTSKTTGGDKVIGASKETSLSGGLSSVLPSFVGLGAGLGTLLGSMLSRRALSGGLIRAGAVGLFLPYIVNFTKDFTETALKNFEFDDEFAESVADQAGKTAFGASIGFAFGGLKGAIAGAAAGLMSSYSDELLEYLEIPENQTFDIMGYDISAGSGASTILAAIGGTVALLAPSLLSLAGKALIPILTGPLGLAAITGVALAGTLMLAKNWMEDRRDSFLAELEEKTNELLNRTEAGELISEEDRSQLGAAYVQYRRAAEMGLPAEQMAVVEENKGRLESVLGDQPLEPAQGINELQINDRITGVLEGNTEDLKDLVMYLQSLGITKENEIFNLLSGMARDNIFSQRDINPETQIEMLNKFEDTVDINLDEILSNSSFRLGTRGFQDFGNGSLAILHGREAVVPANTPAGQVIETFFNTDFTPKINPVVRVSRESMETVSSAAQNVTLNYINNAPNNSTTQVNQTGGSSSSVINTVSNARNDLDMMSIPAGVQ